MPNTAGMGCLDQCSNNIKSQFSHEFSFQGLIFWIFSHTHRVFIKNKNESLVFCYWLKVHLALYGRFLWWPSVRLDNKDSYRGISESVHEQYLNKYTQYKTHGNLPEPIHHEIRWPMHTLHRKWTKIVNLQAAARGHDLQGFFFFFFKLYQDCRRLWAKTWVRHAGSKTFWGHVPQQPQADPYFAVKCWDSDLKPCSDGCHTSVQSGGDWLWREEKP